MTQVTTFLGRLDAAGLAAVGLLAVLAWVRHRGRTRACLAATLGLLGLVSVIGQIGNAVALPALFQALSLIFFMLSGYALVELRHHLIPLPRRVRPVLVALLVLTTAAALPVTIAPQTPARPTALALAIVLLLI
ncbi:MAG: hypothetical protein JOY80_06875, partial [Candidatus Dormibacteraeota bacterium]|nr:hypothetical protein [Candidatus Dormibacteraeota bacterium]